MISSLGTRAATRAKRSVSEAKRRSQSALALLPAAT